MICKSKIKENLFTVDYQTTELTDACVRNESVDWTSALFIMCDRFPVQVCMITKELTWAKILYTSIITLTGIFLFKVGAQKTASKVQQNSVLWPFDKIWFEGEDSACLPSRLGSCHDNPCQLKKDQSLLAQHIVFNLTPDATIHWGIICRASSQTGQVGDTDANGFTGWRPCNFHASCCCWQWITVPNTGPLYRGVWQHSRGNLVGGGGAVRIFSWSWSSWSDSGSALI